MYVIGFRDGKEVQLIAMITLVYVLSVLVNSCLKKRKENNGTSV